jgi:hypothetical protein
MPAIKIAFINESNVLTDAQVQAAIPALQTQVHRDFFPVWGADAELSFVGHGQKPPAGTWWLVVLDNSDQAGTLGYHDLTEEGLPLGKIFAKSDLDKGLKWTVTASHELLEMLVDPALNLAVWIQPENGAGKLYSYEICDPCQADEYGYDIDGVTVANFVFPAWFEPFRKPGTQFDFQNKIQQPLGLLRGGYIGVFELASEIDWHQVNAQTDPTCDRGRAQPGSRRERRRVARKQQWVSSAVVCQQNSP